MDLKLPRSVLPKRLASGQTAYYFNVQSIYRKEGCPIPNEALGTDYAAMCKKAETLNGLLDEWLQKRKGRPVEDRGPRFGTVAWLFRQYRMSNAYTEKVSLRSRKDYEDTMQLVESTPTNKGDTVGSRSIRSITARGADKIYAKIIQGESGERLRQGEKAMGICRKAWKVVQRLYPDEFDSKVPNPWLGVTRKNRIKKKKPAASREEVYKFAWGCIKLDRPQYAAAAVICFEWLQRPENVLAGYIRWTDYRSKEWPTAVHIEHHKTGELVWHPLQETIEGETTLFYEEAEKILGYLPRIGTPMILREVKPSRRVPDRQKSSKPFSRSGFEKGVQKLRKKIGLPEYFTLDACRHGGMTELELAELTEGQGRALSGHKTAQAYRGYAKQSLERALPATRKRHAHLLANTMATSVQNGFAAELQNDVLTLTAESA